jgi:sec-independent protein translocase protein TatB
VGSVGFSEIAVIAIIALFVLGPDRLPQAARSIGKAISEFKRLTSGARADLEDALDATGMRETIAEIRGTVDEMNPRRIVQDSLRTVDGIGTGVVIAGSATTSAGGSSSPFDASLQTTASQVAPPDADVAGIEQPVGSPSRAFSVTAPQFSLGFTDILDDDSV